MELKATAGYIDVDLLKEFPLHKEKKEKAKPDVRWEDKKKINKIKTNGFDK